MISDGDSPAGQNPGPKNPGNLVPFTGKASAKPPASDSAPAKFSPGSPVPLSVRLQVRSFYVLQGFQPSQIAPMVGLSAQQISNLVRREGWKRTRDKQEGKREQKATELQDARAGEDAARVVEALAIHAEGLAVGTLELAGEQLRAKNSKGLQMSSGAALNFVKIHRLSRGLDQRGTNSGGSGPVLAVNLFLVRGETPETMAKAAAIPCEANPVPSQ